MHQGTDARRNDEDDGQLIDTAIIPGGACLQLVKRGHDFEILHGGDLLMGSWDFRSEKALATLVCQRLNGADDHILIGGLGMGFTLGAALEALPSGAKIVVAELVPTVVAWARGTLAHIFGQMLGDPRVSIEVRDVHDLIVESPGMFDAILLDVDNGPDGLVNIANERLYCNWGLRDAFAALRPGGILAIWSSYPDAGFTARLRNAGFRVEEIRIAIEPGAPNYDHLIWLASRPR